MSRLLSLRHRLGRDTSGATIVEFALVLPVMCTLLLGALDLGYRGYVTSIIQGSMHEAVRIATLGNRTPEQIEAHVTNSLREFSADAEIETELKSYYDFTGVGIPEVITADTAPIGQYNPGDCYQDANDNSQYDMDRGRTGRGGADDVLRLKVTMRYPRMVPVGGLMGWSDDVEIVQETVLRNQPFAGRNTGVVTRCS